MKGFETESTQGVTTQQDVLTERAMRYNPELAASNTGQTETSRHESTEKSKHYRKQTQVADEHSHTSTPAFSDITGGKPLESRNTNLDSASASNLTTLPVRPASQAGTVDMPRQINPKDLTNEELEYVIKTGKVPPQYLAFKPHAPTASMGSAGAPSNGTPKQTLAPRMSPRGEIGNRKDYESQVQAQEPSYAD